jgi:hypothetical protein
MLDKKTVDITNCSANQAIALINHIKKTRTIATQLVDQTNNALKSITDILDVPVQRPIILPLSPVAMWNEIHLLPYARSINGSVSYREFIRYNYSDDGTIVVQQLVLPVNEGLEFTSELPKNWKINSMIIPHLHWTPMNDMCGSYENINLTWMIKSVGDTHPQNTFTQTIKIGPSDEKIHCKTDFSPETPTDLTGHNHMIVGHLRRLTEGSSYTDDLFIIGLDFNVMME